MWYGSRQENSHLQTSRTDHISTIISGMSIQVNLLSGGDDSSTEKSYKHPTPWKRGSQAELEALEKFLGNARPNKRLIGEVVG